MNTQKSKTASEGAIQSGSLGNSSINAGGDKSDFSFNIPENAENLQRNLTEHLAQNKKVVPPASLLKLRQSENVGEILDIFGICKSCLNEVKGKGKIAQLNFIARTVNNLHRNLRRAIHNV